jgi:biopolymer transport protein ExbD
MAFASFDNKASGGPMAEINMVPLIDVMLVLLVIFIVTAPLLTHAVKLDLPKVSALPNVLKPEKIEFAIDATGTLYWNGELVSRAEAAARFADEGKKQPQPELHLRADQSVAYRFVAQTLADASKAGLHKVGFVSEPEVPAYAR